MTTSTIYYDPSHNPCVIEIAERSESNAARRYCHGIEWTITAIGRLTRRQIVPHFIAIERDLESLPFGIWRVEVIIDEKEAQIAKAQGRKVYRIDEQGGYTRI